MICWRHFARLAVGSGSRTATCPQQPTDRLVIAFDSVSAACVPACPPDMSPPSMKVASFFRMSSSSSFAAVVAAVIADDAIDDAPHELDRSKSIDDDVLPLTAAEAAWKRRAGAAALYSAVGAKKPWNTVAIDYIIDNGRACAVTDGKCDARYEAEQALSPEQRAEARAQRKHAEKAGYDAAMAARAMAH